VIPESSDVVIHLPGYARAGFGRCSFDGKNPLRMRKGWRRVLVDSLRLLLDVKSQAHATASEAKDWIGCRHNLYCKPMLKGA
jgi:hypothetical protein